MRLYRLLKKPIVTEKTSNMSVQKNVYVFEVSLILSILEKKLDLVEKVEFNWEKELEKKLMWHWKIHKIK